MYDSIEKIGKSTIQHGSYNNRIYLMNLEVDDYPDILRIIEKLAVKESYTKIFTKVPSWFEEAFEFKGYIKEAEIPNFYNGKNDTCFLSKFLDNNRANLSEKESQRIKSNLDLALGKKDSLISLKKKKDYNIKKCGKEDADDLSNLYSKVFKSYPFPIFEEKYLIQTLNRNTIYFGVFNDNKLIAASSAEMDPKSGNAEMTDFATDPDFKGNNLSLMLLREMEIEMINREIKTLYTIARSFSPGMNITFAKQGYEYSGTLINNTNISGRIESMNVWFKDIMT